MQLGFYFDQNRCTGCYTCVLACKNWHNLPPKTVEWIKVITTEQGKYPNPVVAHLISLCYHCDKPTCLTVCPVGAISKREENGLVVIDREKCLGRNSCVRCLKACPYQAPQFGDEKNAKMQKCDLCADRWKEGKKPVCVGSCPTRALDAGPMDKLTKHGESREAAGFKYLNKLSPAIVFHRKQ